jgi:hypothetical protein
VRGHKQFIQHNLVATVYGNQYGRKTERSDNFWREFPTSTFKKTCRIGADTRSVGRSIGRAGRQDPHIRLLYYSVNNVYIRNNRGKARVGGGGGARTRTPPRPFSFQHLILIQGHLHAGLTSTHYLQKQLGEKLHGL